MSSIPKEKFEALIARHSQLQDELAQGPAQDVFVRLSREYAELDPVVAKVREVMEAEQEAEDLQEILQDSSQEPEMLEMARMELAALKPRLEQLDHEVRILLLPKDEASTLRVLVAS